MSICVIACQMHCKHISKLFCLLQDVTKQDFALPTLGPKLVQFREEVRTGRGFQLIRYRSHVQDLPHLQCLRMKQNFCSCYHL